MAGKKKDTHFQYSLGAWDEYMNKEEIEKLETFIPLSEEVRHRIKTELNKSGTATVSKNEIPSELVRETLGGIGIKEVPIFRLSEKSLDLRNLFGLRFIFTEEEEVFISDSRVRHVIISYLTGNPYKYRLIHEFSTDILMFSDNLTKIKEVKSELKDIDSILSKAVIKILKTFSGIKKGMCLVGEIDISKHLEIAKSKIDKTK